MMNQMSALVQPPEEMRKSEMANEVLLHAAPMIMKEPEKLIARSIVGQSSLRTSWLCFPKPKRTATETEALPSCRATWNSETVSADSITLSFFHRETPCGETLLGLYLPKTRLGRSRPTTGPYASRICSRPGPLTILLPRSRGSRA